jgi:crossover junction endodeoxyribonuclease RusA
MAHFDSPDSLPEGRLRAAIQKALGEDDVQRVERRKPKPAPKPARPERATIQREPFTLHVPCEPWSLNYEHQHWIFRHERTAAVRQITCALIPPHVGRFVVPVDIEATPVGVRHDVGNTYPTVKACVDGTVDAGVLRDDRAEFVRKLTMHAPVAVVGSLQRGIVLMVSPTTDARP